MLPSFTTFPVSQTVSSSNTGFDGVAITAGSLGGLNHGTVQGPPPDPNSSEGFKQNIRNAQTLVLHLQEMARKVLNDIQCAYQSKNCQSNTQADFATLNQLLLQLLQALRQTGVGALPLLTSGNDYGSVAPPNSATSTSSHVPPAPSEQALLESTGKEVEQTYRRLQRSQDAAQVAANLVAPDQGVGRTAPAASSSSVGRM